MLKSPASAKEVEARAIEALKVLLRRIPALAFDEVVAPPTARGPEADFVAQVRKDGRLYYIVVEVKSSGQPRHVHTALLQLRDYVGRMRPGAIPVLIAPYLSPEAQELCREYETGFLDFEGNTSIVFDGVYIERQVDSKPPAERRELRSLFKPKAARILRVLLREPNRAWRVTELAEVARVSLGHVSNVRAALIDRGWAEVSPEGLRLTRPGTILDKWRDAYEGPTGQRQAFYTTLHGAGFDKAVREVMDNRSPHDKSVFASFSAAKWLAPYGRVGTEFFYADDPGLESLKRALKLSSASKGENVAVIVPEDDGVFRDCIEPASGIVCTSLVQTYLDLSAAGERGREAAEHLRRERLAWTN